MQRRGHRLKALAAEHALPHYGYAPTDREYLEAIPGVALDSGGELRRPEVFPGRWCRGVTATRMPMPEAAVHEADRAETGEDDIGPSG